MATSSPRWAWLRLIVRECTGWHWMALDGTLLAAVGVALDGL
jgi:hypothetical protein